MAKKKKRDRLNTQVIFLFITLIAIIASFLIFSYFFNKMNEPCFDYHGFNACAVVLPGSDIIFYSIPVNFKVGGFENQNNVVVRTDPRKVDELGIIINVPDILLKTRPSMMYVTMDPESNSKTVAAAYEIVKFSSNLEFPSLMAFTEDVGNNQTNVIKCEQATNSERVIWMKYSETEEGDEKVSSISISDYNPYCIVIESNSYDGLIEASDAFVLDWLLRITEKK